VLGSRVVRTPSGDIAVFRTGDDEVFALDDRCPHKGGPLSQGIVHNKRVTCPLHNFVIELKAARRSRRTRDVRARIRPGGE
jgi:nitrite reductase (NADH) small subunit